MWRRARWNRVFTQVGQRDRLPGFPGMLPVVFLRVGSSSELMLSRVGGYGARLAVPAGLQAHEYKLYWGSEVGRAQKPM